MNSRKYKPDKQAHIKGAYTVDVVFKLVGIKNFTVVFEVEELFQPQPKLLKFLRDLDWFCLRLKDFFNRHQSGLDFYPQNFQGLDWLCLRFKNLFSHNQTFSDFNLKFSRT